MQRDARAADLSGNQISSAEYSDRIDRPDLIAHTIAKVDAAVSRLAQIQSSLRRRHCTPSPCPLTSPAPDLRHHHPHALSVSPQFHVKVPPDRGLHTAVLNLNQPQKKYYAHAPFLLNPRFSPPPSTIGVADGGGRISKTRRRWTMPEETVIVSGQSTQSSTATTVDADLDKLGGDGKENIDARCQTARSVKQKQKKNKKKKNINQENNDRIVGRIKSHEAFQKDDKPISSSHITTPHEASKPSVGISKPTKPSVKQQTYTNDGRAILENKAVNVSATTKEACSSWNASDFQQLPVHYRLQKDVTAAANGNEHGHEHYGPRDGELNVNVRPETAAIVRPKPAQKNSSTGKGMKITTEHQKRPYLPKSSGPKLRSRNVAVTDQEGFPQKHDELDSSCAERLQVIQRSILPGASLSDNIQDAEGISVLKPSSVTRDSGRKIGVDEVAERFPWQMNHQTDSAVQRQQSSSASPALTSISDRTNTAKGTSNHRHKNSAKAAVLNTSDHQKYKPPWRSITIISNKRSITTMTIAERVMSAVTHHKSAQLVSTNHAVTMEKSKPQKKIISKKTASKKKKKTSTDEEEEGVLEGKKPSNMEDVLAMVRMRSKRIPFSKRAERDAATACNRAVEGTIISRSEYHQHHDQKFVGTAFCVDVIPSPNRPWRLSSKSSSSAKHLVMFPNPAFKASNLYNHPGYGAHVDPGTTRKLDIRKNSCTSSTPFKIFQLPPLIKTSKTNISDRAGESDHQLAENSSSFSSNNNSDNISIIFSVSTSQSTSPSANCDSSGSSIARKCKINSENTCKKMITVKKDQSRLSKHQPVPSSTAHSNDHLTSNTSGHSIMKRLSLLLWRRREIVEATSLPTLITRLPRRRLIDNRQLSIPSDSLSNVRQPPDHLCTTTLTSKSSIAITRTCNMANSINSTPLPLPPSLRGNIIMQAAISSDHAHPSPSMINKGEKETRYNMNRSLSNCKQIQVEEGTSYSLTPNSIDEPRERESLIDINNNESKKKTTKSKERSLQTCFWWRNGSGKKKKKKMMMNKTRSEKKFSSIWPYR